MATEKRIRIYASSLESAEIPIDTDADPTGAAPEFALSAEGAVTPGSFSSGAWSGSYNASTNKTTARTPTLGGSGTLVIASGSTYSLWVRITLGSETAVWRCGVVECP